MFQLPVYNEPPNRMVMNDSTYDERPSKDPLKPHDSYKIYCPHANEILVISCKHHKKTLSDEPFWGGSMTN